MSLRIGKTAVVAAIATLLLAGATTPAFAETGNRAANAGSGEASAEYVVNVGGQTVDLGEGGSATFGMVAANPGPASGSGISPMATYFGDCGSLTVTASAGVFHWSINMTCPATTFVGAFHVTDRNNGQSGGFTPAGPGFSGSAGTSRLHGHTYAGSLDGTAFLAGIPVAYTMPNNTAYKYP